MTCEHHRAGCESAALQRIDDFLTSCVGCGVCGVAMWGVWCVEFVVCGVCGVAMCGVWRGVRGVWCLVCGV
jgi:hypothetical protein